MTSSNDAYIRLVTDGKLLRPSFAANYEKSEDKITSSDSWYHNILLFHVGNCTHVLNQASGDILMPDYPDGYTGAQECHWHITVTTGSLVGIMFQSLEVRVYLQLSGINCK